MSGVSELNHCLWKGYIGHTNKFQGKGLGFLDLYPKGPDMDAHTVLFFTIEEELVEDCVNTAVSENCGFTVS